MQVAFLSAPVNQTTSNAAPEEIAADPNTPASVLQELYQSHQQHYDRTTYKWVAETPEVMFALAQNPNTPPAILSALLPGYAPAFCQNPVAPFVLLEAPDFLSDVGTNALRALLFCANAPAALIRILPAQASASGKVGKDDAAILADAARTHIAFAGECAPGAWQGELETICREICENPPGSDAREFHADYAELGLLPRTWPEAVSPLPTVKNTKLSKELNGHPWRDKAGSVLVKALAPNLAPELLRAMANESDHTLSQALVLYAETPADVLQTVASAEFAEMRLRLYAAKHRNAGQALLSEFAADSNPFLRRLARQHRNAPVNARALGRTTAIQKRGATPLWLLVSGLYGKLTLEEIRKRTESPVWMERLSAVFAITNGATRVSDERRALLRERTGDANRFVRAAAQAFLENPEYRFSW